MTREHEPSDPNAKPLDRVALLKGAMVGAVISAGFLVVVGVTLFRQTVPVLEQAEFDNAADRWQQRGPKNYDCEIQIVGNRPGVVRIEVRAGEAVRMTRDGTEPSQRRTWDAWTVEGMFDTIDRELQIAADPTPAVGGTAKPQLNASFNADFGYPEVFRRSVPGAQQDMGWQVTRFERKE